MSKDYYKILGVQEDADELVIRAAYLALLKRYNLDDWKDNNKKQLAIKMLADINEAYSVLKDRHERLEYNSVRQKQQEEEVKPVESSMSDEEVDAAWKVACNYYNDLEVLYFNLFQISEQVANNFKVSILVSKDYQNRNKLAAKYELDYLKSQFGNDQDLIDFGKELILEEADDAIADLRHVYEVMGSSVHAEEVIENISDKYQTQRYFLNIEKERVAREELAEKQKELLKRQQEMAAKELKERESGRWGLFWLFILIIMISSALFLLGKDESEKVTSKEGQAQSSLQGGLASSDNSTDFKNLSLGQFRGVGDGSDVTLSILNNGEDFFVELTTVAMPDLRTPAGEQVLCSGGVEGKLISSSNNDKVFTLIKRLYENTSSSEYCTIKITRLIHADGYSVEENNCSVYHGMRCTFNSSYLARK